MKFNRLGKHPQPENEPTAPTEAPSLRLGRSWAPPPPREQGGWATVTTCIQQHPGGASQSNKKAEIKGIVILYKENLREPGKQFLELISEFSKAAEYKINIQKSIVTSQQPDK